MKTFVYTKESRTSKTMSGSMVTAQVYQITKNTPKHVLEVKWNTASYKGDLSAIMNALAEKGVLPKKYAEGYYTIDECNFNIFGL
jgi:hypothetical protein